jgi:hypothetical protein
MRARRGRAGLRHIVAVTVSVVVATGIAAGATFDDYFPLAVGTTWTYRETGPGFATTYTETVVDLGDAAIGLRYDFQEAAQQVARFVRYQGLLAVAEITGSSFDNVYTPPCIMALADLTPGHTETVTCSGTVFGYSFTRTSTILGYADVTVPAGSFQGALEVMETRQTVGVPQTAYSNLWFAMGVGIVKSTSGNATWELISFGSTPTVAPTQTPTMMRTQTPTPLATPTEARCTGDCNNDGHVTVDEILTMVNIALGNRPASDCSLGDANGDHQITVDEILISVNNALNGCVQSP